MFPLLDLYIDSFFITLKQMICFQSGSLPLGPRTCYTRQLMTGLPISSLLVWSFCAVKHFEQDQPLWAATALHCPQPTKALLQSCTAELIKPLSARCPRVFGLNSSPIRISQTQEYALHFLKARGKKLLPLIKVRGDGTNNDEFECFVKCK